jgi:probable HAF family extracellular repeat protein
LPVLAARIFWLTSSPPTFDIPLTTLVVLRGNILLSAKGFVMKHLSFLLAILAAACCAAQTSYTVTDLGTLPGGAYSGAHAINATGEVTGYAYSSSSVADVFLYNNGSLTSLGTLGGTTGIGNGINSSGVVAGYSTDSAGTYRAFVSSGGSLVNIGDLGGGSAVAYAINDLGQVVGSAVTSNGENHPFLYSNGQMLDLGTLGSSGNDWWNSAQGVNNAGAVVGTSYDATGNFFGFVWSNGKMQKVGTLGGPWSQGYAINNKGQITGLAYTKTGGAHAFIANGATGKLRDLGTFSAESTTWGFAINDSGVVVGQSTYAGTYHAFVYSAGKIKDLNKLIPSGSGWVLNSAGGINNAGQIVGEGTINGKMHGFLLTPQ